MTTVHIVYCEILSLFTYTRLQKAEQQHLTTTTIIVSVGLFLCEILFLSVNSKRMKAEDLNLERQKDLSNEDTEFANIIRIFSLETLLLVVQILRIKSYMKFV